MKIERMKIIKLKNGVFSKDTSKINPLIFTSIIILGIITGVILVSTNQTLYSEAESILNTFLKTNISKNFFDLFMGNFLYNALFIIVPMICGLCAVGFIPVYFVPFFKGAGIGAVSAVIYSAFSIKGIGYCMLIVFPVALIQFIAIILSCNESFLMSSDLLGVIRKENTAEQDIRINLFLLRYLIITVIILFSSVMYALSNLLFFRMLTI